MFEDIKRNKIVKKRWTIEEITNMYDEIESDIHYDCDDISMIICDRIIDRDKMFSNEEYYRFIYDIFDICITHLQWKNNLEDLKKYSFSDR